jgi:hypothetical protein
MPVMSSWISQTSLKLPVTGKTTVNFSPLLRIPLVIQLVPSKVAEPAENPGQPTLKGGRIWPSVRKVTVCGSAAVTHG